MHFLILSNIALVFFSILVVIRVIQFAGYWDVIGPHLYVAFIPAFQCSLFSISCLLFYMSFDYKKMKDTYSSLFCFKKNTQTMDEKVEQDNPSKFSDDQQQPDVQKLEEQKP